MYDPSIGRWIEEDPDAFAAGDVNLSRYVRNDPVDATDPSGLLDVSLAAKPASEPFLNAETGSYIVPISWQLSKNAGADGGLIIQLVTEKFTLWDASGKSLGTYNKKYYEAWLVPPGKNGPDPAVNKKDATAYNDMYTLLFPRKPDGTVGPVARYEDTVSGQAYYLEGCTAIKNDLFFESLTALTSPLASAMLFAIQPYAYMSVDNPHTNAGALLSVPWTPLSEGMVNSLLSRYDHTKPVQHDLKATWDRAKGKDPQLESVPIIPGGLLPFSLGK
jgi:hypothetical protein